MVLASALVSGCGGGSCPEGTVETEGRCITPSDAGANDASSDAAAIDASGLDAFVDPGVDAPLPDVFVPMGVDAGELPDVFVELPDAYVSPDACTPSTFYVDGDGDGHGDPAMTVLGCSMPAGAVALGDDCNDAAMTVHPGATELCDGLDQDCDPRLDEGSGPIAAFYPDGDADGHGVIGGASVMACAAPPGRAPLADDCNDAANTIYPGAAELCNGVDEDCDSGSDEGIQRLLRTPHELVPPGGVEYDGAYVAPLVDGYAIVYQTAAGAVVRRVRADGTTVGTPRTVTASTAEGPTLIATSPTRVAVGYSRLVSGLSYSLHAVSVDFATEPASVSAEVTIASATNTVGPTLGVVEGRLLVSWLFASGEYARSYALDLTDAGPATSLAPYPMSGMTFFRGDGATWVAYSAERPSTTGDECYLQRLDVSPLTLRPELTAVGDGSAECFMLFAPTREGRAQAVLAYGGGARFESAGASVTTTAMVTRRSALTLPMPYGSAVPATRGSPAGMDFAISTAVGTPPILGQYLPIGASSVAASPASFGGSEAIAAFSIARMSSRHGAIVYVATPTGGSTHALYLQEIGCE